jgi:hypothetical protein
MLIKKMKVRGNALLSAVQESEPLRIVNAYCYELSSCVCLQ